MSIVAASGIPSPSQGVWYLGPIPLRAYGIIIAVGMVVGVWWTARRYRQRGGNPDTLYDVRSGRSRWGSSAPVSITL